MNWGWGEVDDASYSFLALPPNPNDLEVYSMRVKMLTSMCSATANYVIGDECDLDDGEAKRLIEAGLAESVRSVEGNGEAPRRTSRRKVSTATQRDDVETASE